MAEHEKNNDAIPEPTYDDPKELYAFFGMAMYQVQLLEQGITNLIVGLRIKGQYKPTVGDVIKLYEGADRHTLGQLLNAVRQLQPFSSELDDQVIEALQKRNYLAHRFFVEHAEDLLSEQGRRGMIDELIKTIRVLKAVDSEVDDLWITIWSRYGLTRARIERELEKLLKALDSKMRD
jgi:translation initiation factor RLI1